MKLLHRTLLPIVRLVAVAAAAAVAFHAIAARAQTSAEQRPATAAAAYESGAPYAPGHVEGGFDLPNGWRITPAGKDVGTIGDWVLNLVTAPDGRAVIATHSGYLPHGVDVFDTQDEKMTQNIGLRSTWLGLAWSADGKTLFVSGGNAAGEKSIAPEMAPIYEFGYADGRLSDKPAGKLMETVSPKTVWWAGVAYLPEKHWLYAANRGTGPGPSDVVVFDVETGAIVARIPVEVNPYALVLTPDGQRLFVSNWASQSVSVIDTATNTVIRTLHVGMNPNDMKLAKDGRLFVACSNDNTVYAIDSRTLEVTERLSTTLTPLAPEGSTPDALAIDDERKLLYIANADNNSVAVVNIVNREHSTVEGFIPTGWYPAALALADGGRTLYIGDAKGEQSYPDMKSVGSPLASKWYGDETIKTLQTASVEAVNVSNLKEKLAGWTRQVMENTPYRDSLLSEAPPAREPSVVPREVGVTTPIKHVIYIIKENRTYDQEFGDLKGANGDPELTIFGEKVTPNQHALAREYVILDNLYCDGEVSVDGHSWSDSAYATDFNEKLWPPTYAGWSAAQPSRAYIPSAGHLWDLAARKGLTYRSYGEYAARASTGTTMQAAPGVGGLVGHVSPDYLGFKQRDTQNVAIFLNDLKGWEANYDSADPEKRLPNFTVMSMPEDHTKGTTPGAYTPRAMVASNDYAIGELVDAVSHSKYWPSTAIFIIEDDAQDGSDHVDARRTVGLVLSPYVKRGIVDSTFYSTSSMVRTIELLLGLPPMSQYDASATPMYNSFGTAPEVTPFNAIAPMIDVDAKNTKDSYGAAASAKMDFSQVDHAPMHALNEILWKSIKGADVPMPAPVHRFRPLIDASGGGDGD